MTKGLSIINAGDIELSDQVVVSDPCYCRDLWCAIKNITVKPGKYATYIVNKKDDEGGGWATSLMVVHTDFVTSLKTTWEPYSSIVVGVDSGSCGIFDNAAYPADGESVGEFDDEHSFYGECCTLTQGKGNGGILSSHNGVVSSSGYGDGTYALLCQHCEGERVALMIDFGLEQCDVVTKALMKQWCH